MRPVSQLRMNCPRVCIVGKGPSLVQWKNVKADIFISCNEAIYQVRKGIFTRFDDPCFPFCEELPPGVVAVVPRQFRLKYPDGYYFAWHAIGMHNKIPATGAVAMYIAEYIGAQEIILCGFDGLRPEGSREYHPSVANERNKLHGLKDQTSIFQKVDEAILAKVRHWDEAPLDIGEPPKNGLPPSKLRKTSTERQIPAVRVLDGGFPQMKMERGDTLLHLSEFPDTRPPEKAIIVGKGPTMMEWRNVEDAEAIFTVNEATYAVDRQHFHCRGDGNRKFHRFCDWLPKYAVPIVPERIKDYYNYGYWFRWTDIGSDGICLTSIQAVRLAYWMGCRNIVLCGLDALRTGDESYNELVVNKRNAKYKMRDQKDRFRALPEPIKEACRHFDGTPIVNPEL